MRYLLIGLTICAMCSPSSADKEAPSRPVLFSDSTGSYYVRSVPESREDQYAGTTRVYRTGAEADTLLCEYDWYASRLWLYFDGNDLILVRLGPWHRTGTDPETELELGFYKDGKILREYSVLDIAVKEENLVHSESHYAITSRVAGIVRRRAAHSFALRTFDGRDLRFALSDGAILEPAGHAAEPDSE
jgi:hypothetical protein